MKKKITIVIVSFVLTVCCVAGGTLAWLMDTTENVVNTFTVGDVDIKLEEHAYNPEDTDAKLNDEVKNKNDYPLIPGTAYFKDPKVTVLKGSEDCYLFVKITETNNPATYLDYELNLNGWTKLESESGVYYRVVEKNTEKDQSWELLVDNKVTVKITVVKKGTTITETVYVEMPDNNPVLTFTAYAVQKDNIADSKAAWDLVNP